METFLKRVCLFCLVGFLVGKNCAFPMGGKPETQTLQSSVSSDQLENATATKITISEVGHVFWPDSDYTQIQQEETLKNILGKRVNWEIIVAQVRRDGNEYIIQGQSDKDMVGTFSYITPTTEREKTVILKSSRGTKLNITGIVKDMNMRHIVLRPARIIEAN